MTNEDPKNDVKQIDTSLSAAMMKMSCRVFLKHLRDTSWNLTGGPKAQTGLGWEVWGGVGEALDSLFARVRGWILGMDKITFS